MISSYTISALLLWFFASTPDTPEMRLDGAAASGHIMYLNPCPGDCSFSFGADDSVNDTSSLGSFTLSELQLSDMQFGEIAQCFENLFAPFDVRVVLEDPSPIRHTEVVIAGAGSEAGYPGVGGVAPFNCGFIDNAPVFAFGNLFGSNLRVICEIAAQQAASSFGLDHHFFCPDVQTFLGDCGPKSFQNLDMPCGEFEERACSCGGSTENSFQVLGNTFGVLQLVFADGFEADSVAQ